MLWHPDMYRHRETQMSRKQSSRLFLYLKDWSWASCQQERLWMHIVCLLFTDYNLSSSCSYELCTLVKTPSGSALVRRRPAIASGLLSSGCTLSLRPTGSVGLLPPFSSTWVLSRSGSAADLWSSAFALVARALGSTLAPRILGIPLARWLSVSASGSSTTCSATVGRPPGVGGHHSSMATPSVGSTVGHHHGCGLGPARLLLLRIPPVSSLAPPSFVTSLVSVSRPPPGWPSSSWAAS